SRISNFYSQAPEQLDPFVGWNNRLGSSTFCRQSRKIDPCDQPFLEERLLRLVRLIIAHRQLRVELRHGQNPPTSNRLQHPLLYITQDITIGRQKIQNLAARFVRRQKLP